jgi:hypothetical protein
MRINYRLSPPHRIDRHQLNQEWIAQAVLALPGSILVLLNCAADAT